MRLDRPTLRLLVIVLVTVVLTPASAQEIFPSRAIKIVVPYPAGGTADAMARALGQELNTAWSQPVLIDNRRVRPQTL